MFAAFVNGRVHGDAGFATGRAAPVKDALNVFDSRIDGIGTAGVDEHVGHAVREAA